jgi:hypothetical protein
MHSLHDVREMNDFSNSKITRRNLIKPGMDIMPLEEGINDSLRRTSEINTRKKQSKYHKGEVVRVLS